MVNVIQITTSCGLILVKPRFIVAWRLCVTMSGCDVSDTLGDALEFAGVDQVDIKQKPKLLSGNGSSYVTADLKAYDDLKPLLDQATPCPKDSDNVDSINIDRIPRSVEVSRLENEDSEKTWRMPVWSNPI